MNEASATSRSGPAAHRAAATGAPRWAGLASAGIGAFALLWLIVGLAFLLFADSAKLSAAAAKSVLLACIPAALIGAVLAAAGLQERSQAAMVGAVLCALALLGAFGLIVAAYAASM